MTSSPAKPGLGSPAFLPSAGPNAPQNTARDSISTQSSSYRPRNVSLSSESSDSSHLTSLSNPQGASPHGQPQRHQRPQPSPLGTHANASTSSLQTNFSRPTTARVVFHETASSSREQSPVTAVVPSGAPWHAPAGHRRQRSQGYFEPTLPSTSHSPAVGSPISSQPERNMSTDTAKIAAQAASAQHIRKRSMTVPDPNDPTPKGTPRKGSSPPPPMPSFNLVGARAAHHYDDFAGGHKLAAATAARNVYAKSPGYTPILSAGEQQQQQQAQQQHQAQAQQQQSQQQHQQQEQQSAFAGTSIAPEKELKKEKSKMNLFKKPKNISIAKDKDVDKKYALPSPNKVGMQSTGTLGRFANTSMTSLVDPVGSSASSLYSSANVSTSTLVPSGYSEKDGKDKEKHKHNFLSRSKNKLKDKDPEHFHLPLSSSSSTSRPTDPNAPQPLYSFAAPASPGHSSSFAKSVSGFDLRHGGKALREKKKEEKAAAANLLTPLASSSMSIMSSDSRTIRDRDDALSVHRSEWPGFNTAQGLTPTAGADVVISQPVIQHLATSFEMPGMGPDEAWPLLKARLLLIFEQEIPRPPIEDFNALVAVWIRRYVQLGNPTMVVEDLNEMLNTGFSSLNQTLARVPDERLVPSLVDLWHMVFSTILPFMQAVFLPLDLEFKGRGSIMTAQEAAEWWGARLPPAMSRGASQQESRTSMDSDIAMRESSPVDANIPVLGEDLDVRRMVLLTFRDAVILPHIDPLLSIFSRLSLENLSSGFAFNASPLPEPPSLATLVGEAGPTNPSRPSTAPSVDPSTGSFSSSAGMDSNLSSLSGARSRATSNTSAGSFGSIPGILSPHPQHAQHSHSNSLPHHSLPPTSNVPSTVAGLPVPMDSAKVTEIVGRMLQCVSVLAGVQTADKSQESMERLAREMKLNWLGRGRTGRQRRGFVGTRPPRAGQSVEVR